MRGSGSAVFKIASHFSLIQNSFVGNVYVPTSDFVAQNPGSCDRFYERFEALVTALPRFPPTLITYLASMPPLAYGRPTRKLPTLPEELRPITSNRTR
jgi:hypothetical protein